MRPIQIKDLKKGMTVVEIGYGASIEMNIQKDAEQQEEGWQSVGLKEDGTEVYLYAANGAEHYGPKLYLVEEIE